MSEETLAVTPVSAFEVKTVPSVGGLLMQVDYITHPSQSPEDAQRTPILALTARQARELAETLLKGVKLLDAVAAPVPGSAERPH